ncbi:hypothetical protein ETH_00034055 [Eimeria tenella]|uniref:Uncharacterized protein n=1 Tax=Eimeria tenella TaxID=5802 RepID=U6L474_EIMTE|nr:hypothetical protein ETH_00034055 [Eimeria tenella]CDJ44941.1 hypothetical protein ETH_00034055 [Eimeria tenella]|eukprot:XP_013235688.1 hypothetical protein ETH_00034055 [Eimeria tenella]
MAELQARRQLEKQQRAKEELVNHLRVLETCPAAAAAACSWTKAAAAAAAAAACSLAAWCP